MSEWDYKYVRKEPDRCPQCGIARPHYTSDCRTCSSQSVPGQPITPAPAPSIRFPDFGRCNSCGEPFYTRTDAHSHGCGGRTPDKPAAVNSIMSTKGSSDQYSGQAESTSAEVPRECEHGIQKFWCPKCTPAHLPITPASQPKEFWIDENMKYVEAYGEPFTDTAIHVIEKSAYDTAMSERLHFWQICVKRAEEVEKLKAERDELKAKLPTFIKLDATTEQILRENAYIANAKQSMKDIAELRHENHTLRRELSEAKEIADRHYANFNERNHELRTCEKERDEARAEVERLRLRVKDLEDGHE